MTRMQCGVMAGLRCAALVIILGSFPDLFAGRAEAQGLIFHGGSYYRSRVVMRNPGAALSLAPGTVVPTQALNLSPWTGHVLTLSPTVPVQSIHLSPTTLSLSPQTTFYPTSGSTSGATLSLAPLPAYQLIGGTNSGITLNPATVPYGTQSIPLNAGAPTVEQGMQVLSLGFRHDPVRLNGFLQSLRTKLEGLVGAVGKNLSRKDVTDLLMIAAKDALAGSGYGFLVDPVVEMFLKPVIDKLVGDRLPAYPDPNAHTPGQPTPSVPSGGMSFTVSGTLFLTPATGGGKGQNGGSNGQVTPGTPPLGDLRRDPGGSAAPSIGP
jgi:hypothetical protein